MAAGDDIGSVLDERGDRREALLWGTVFLFTFALFVYEFGNGIVEPEEEGLLPIATVVDFKQTMFLAALVGGGLFVGLLVWMIYRHSSGVRDHPAPMLPGEGRFRLTVFVLAVLVIMSTTIFVGASTLAQTDEATPATAAEQIGASQRIHMQVTAGQWFWRFDVDGIPYSQGDRVVLPAETLVVFETTSADVVHSFAIKDLGITKDAIPGQSNQAWFYVGEVHGETSLSVAGETIPADTYEVRCAELCGKAHSQMIATVYVVPPEQYETWAHAKGGEAAFESTGVGGGHEEAESDDAHSDEESSESGADHAIARPPVTGRR